MYMWIALFLFTCRGEADCHCFQLIIGGIKALGDGSGNRSKQKQKEATPLGPMEMETVVAESPQLMPEGR